MYNIWHMKNKYKPDLSIETPSEDNDVHSEISEKRKFRRINSAKNCSEMKKFNFNFGPPYRVGNFTKQEKIKRLEKQKAQLMKSLQILKNGAVSAIIEKQETIDKLRKLFAEQKGNQTQDHRMQELQNLLSYIKDLEDERNELKSDLDLERRRFEHEIIERQNYIEELIRELNWSSDRISSLENYENLLMDKINVMEQANQNLSFLLNKSQASSSNDQQIGIDTTTRKISFIEEDYCSKSMEDNFHQNFPNQELNLCLNSQLFRSQQENQIGHKIKEINDRHQFQIQQLTDFYESRIQSLKKICTSDSESLPRRLVQVCQDQRSGSRTILDIPDNRSNNTNQTQETRKRMFEYERILKKNLSLTSFKSGNSKTKFEPIDEREQMELCPTRRSLKRQLMSTSDLNRVASKNSLTSNREDCESQYSYRSYDLPQAGFKKNKINKQKESTKGESWDKLLWFTIGTLTGGSLLSIGQKLFKQ